MKYFAIILSCIGFTSVLNSQSVISSIPYNKVSEPAIMLELPYGQDVAEGFIIDNLKKTGYDPESKGKLFWKQNKVNGFYVFKGVMLEGQSQPVDLYFKVDQKSRKQKDASVIYLLVSKGNDMFISSGADDSTFNSAKKMMDNFVSQSATYKLDLDIKAQENVVKSAEKKLTKLQDNERDLTKKIAQLQDDLKRNRAEQDNQQKTIENERRNLGDLKARAVHQ